MTFYTYKNLTEFPNVPKKNGETYLNFVNCNFQKVNLEHYGLVSCTFDNCQIVEPLIINCYCLLIKKSDIKLSEHVKVEVLSIQHSNFTIIQKINVEFFIIYNSTIKDIHNIDYNECKIYIENNNDDLLNMIINGDLFKDKHTHYDLSVSSRYKDKVYNFIYNYADYNIFGHCDEIFFSVLRNECKKIKLIKAIEALQKKLKNGIE